MKIERDFEEQKNLKRITAEEFSSTGALWLVNSILNVFGMSIVYDPVNGEMFPAITKFRGFSAPINESGYIKLTQYMRDNIQDLTLDLGEDIDS